MKKANFKAKNLNLNKIFRALVLFNFVLSLQACQIKKSDPLVLIPNPATKQTNPTPPQNPISLDELSYSLVSEKVLAKSCVGCHSEKGGNKGDVNLETYENVVKYKIQIRDEVGQKKMPPRKRNDLALSDIQIKMVLDWIDIGAPLEARKKPVPPDLSQPISFKQVFDQIIVPHCIKCHSAEGGNKGDVNLETYENVFEWRFEVKFNIETDQMPPKPPKGIPLSEDQKKMIISWFDQGALKEPVAPNQPVVPNEPGVLNQ